MKPIKPEDVLSPHMAIMLSLGVLIFTVFVVYGTIHWFHSIGVPYDPIYEVVFGWMWSLPAMLIVAYLRAILLTRKKDFSDFSKMLTLDIIALSPFISGILKYSTHPDGLNIPFARDAVCLVAAFAMIAELYYTVRTYMRDNT